MAWRCLGALAALLLPQLLIVAAAEQEPHAAKRVTRHVAGVPVYMSERPRRLSASGPEQAKSTWIIRLLEGSNDNAVKAFNATLPRNARVVFEGHPSEGGMPIVVIEATEADLQTVLQRNPLAKYVDEDMDMGVPEPAGLGAADGELQILDSTSFWGLDRIDDRNGLDQDYSDYHAAGGRGANVYVLDTGIMTTHSEFAGNRAVPALEVNSTGLHVCNGATNCARDGHGHGTHCAGTIAGATAGVARGAKVHAVKVLSDSGSGSFSWFEAAIDWVMVNGDKPAVISASLGGLGYMRSIDEAITEAAAVGVTVVVAAGNNGQLPDLADACSYMPAAAVDAITVGSTTSSDARSTFSNVGHCVDIFAPGSSIISASPSGSFVSMSGTSMACPHVAGAAALLLGENLDRTPAEIKSILLQRSSPNAITETVTDRAWQIYDTPNRLLYVGGGAAVAHPTPSPCLSQGHGWHTTGDCCIDSASNCATSPNWPASYGDGTTCTIVVDDASLLGPVSAKSFTVEYGDSLTLNGAAYHHVSGPQHVLMNQNGVWSANSALSRRGWRLCPDTPYTPPTSPATTTVGGVTTTQVITTTNPAPSPAPGSCGAKGPDMTPWGTSSSSDDPTVSPTIVNGQTATPCEWPWQVSLRRTSGFAFCGGTLIHARWVLTAAHCVVSATSSSVKAVVGDHDKSSVGSVEQTLDVQNIYVHPNYNSQTLDSDFALLELATEPIMGECVATACLPDSDVAEGTECWITGWGTLSSGGSTPDLLQEAKVSIVSQSSCNSAYSGQITDTMVCAQGVNAQGGVTDACQGDSGGPLVCSTGAGGYEIHGATSWGAGCAQASHPGIWARVWTVRSWILSHMGGAVSTTVTTTTTHQTPTCGGLNGCGWQVVEGPCVHTSDNCISSPNFPSEYGINQRCTISVTQPVLGAVTANPFNTEAGYDKLYINNVEYHGNNGPVGVTPTASIIWSSDYSVTRSGWKLCRDTTATMTTTGTVSTTSATTASVTASSTVTMTTTVTTSTETETSTSTETMTTTVTTSTATETETSTSTVTMTTTVSTSTRTETETSTSTVTMTTTSTTSTGTETSTSTATMTTTPTTAWEVIAKQDISLALFDSSARQTFLQNENDPNAPAYMAIGNMDSADESLRFGGVYRFRLSYGSSVMLEWEQSSWLTEPLITGFSCVAPADCGPSTLQSGLRFQGLGRSSNGWSVLDGNGASQWPFNSVGSLQVLGGGIPGWNFTSYQTMELRIARKAGATTTSTTTSWLRRLEGLDDEVPTSPPTPATTLRLRGGSTKRL